MEWRASRFNRRCNLGFAKRRDGDKLAGPDQRP